MQVGDPRVALFNRAPVARGRIESCAFAARKTSYSRYRAI